MSDSLSAFVESTAMKTDEMVEKLSKAEVIRRMQALVPPGSPEPQDPQILAQLQVLTAQLIQTYQNAGSLQEDPFAEVWNRRIHLYEAEAQARLVNKVVMVTGGQGCVGSHLILKLVTLGVRRIVIVDCAQNDFPLIDELTAAQRELLIHYSVDIRNSIELQEVFAAERPQVVFHLAAQRLPGLAEIKIHETITTNVLGTRNVIEACEAHGVEYCIFSSTGKASRYFTAEVYAASKKLAEWQLAQATRTGQVTYGMVRFTHMLNNSSFCEQYDNKVRQGKVVNVHAPNRYVVGQNVSEAVHLLLNSLAIAQPKRLQFLLCRNLGWPVETLEVALYKILKSGQNLPIYFQGLLPGYEESFFRGQVDWDHPENMNTLINVVEVQNSQIDPSGDMIIADAPECSPDLLEQHLARLTELTTRPEVTQPDLKVAQAQAIRELARSILTWATPAVLMQILRWGTDARQLKAEGSSLNAHQEMIDLFIQSLHERFQRDSSNTVPFPVPMPIAEVARTAS